MCDTLDLDWVYCAKVWSCNLIVSNQLLSQKLDLVPIAIVVSCQIDQAEINAHDWLSSPWGSDRHYYLLQRGLRARLKRFQNVPVEAMIPSANIALLRVLFKLCIVQLLVFFTKLTFFESECRTRQVSHPFWDCPNVQYLQGGQKLKNEGRGLGVLKIGKVCESTHAAINIIN